MPAPDFNFDIKARDKTKAGFDRARNNARRFNGDLDQTRRQLNLGAVAAKAFAAAFTVTAVANFTSSVRSAVEETSRLAKISDKVGVATEDWQRLLFGFGQAGVASADMERNFEQLNKRISEATFFGNRLGDILKANNIPLKEQNGDLRSNVAILRDLADLIQNAASDQERMTIATEAFGRSGGDMILALRNGAAGMDELLSRAESAGGVIDDALIRRAEELDDKIDAVSRTIQINMTTALLGAADVFDIMISKASDLESFLGRLGSAEIFQKFNENFLGIDPDKKYTVVPGQGVVEISPSALKGGRIGTPSPEQIGLTPDAIREWYSGTAPKTVIPETKRSGRKASASAAREEVSAYDKVIQKLREEYELIGLSDSQRRIAIEQRRAGVEASSAQGRAIADLVTKMEAEEERLEKLRQAQEQFNQSVEYLQDAGFDAFFSIVDGSQSAEEAIKRLGMEILRAATYAMLFNRGPLAGLFGGLFGGGGIFGSIGFRAAGGPVDPFGTYVVGENGPELLRMGSRGGRVSSNSESFGGPSDKGINITMGVSVDRNGNLIPFIESITEQKTAAAVSRMATATPMISQQTSRNANLRNVQPVRRIV